MRAIVSERAVPTVSKTRSVVRRNGENNLDQPEEQMRYMVFVKMAQDPGEPPQALVDAMGAEMKQAFADGTMIDAGGLWGPPGYTEIRLQGGGYTTSDGPYAEAKEIVGGYSIIEVRSHDEAVENARRVLELHAEHWAGWEGAVEIRRIAGPEDIAPQGA
jgi:hypothetical protein